MQIKCHKVILEVRKIMKAKGRFCHRGGEELLLPLDIDYFFFACVVPFIQPSYEVGLCAATQQG